MPSFLASLAGIPWRLWAWFAAAFGGALALAVAYGKGRKAEKAKRDADALQSMDAGRRAVAGRRASGETPDQTVRRNDGAWQ